MIEKLVSEMEWDDALAGFPVFPLPHGPVIFLAPHPDDESLAAGGLLAALAERKAHIMVVAITDGDAAYHPEGDPTLAALRRREQAAALAALGISREQLIRLDVPDRRVEANVVTLAERLISLLEDAGPVTTLIAPWRHDFHSDHEAAGRAAEIAAERTGNPLIRWFWWSWHRRTVADLTALPLKRFSLEPRWLQRKLAAIDEHRSQLGEDAILSRSLLAPAHRRFEVFA